MQDLPGRPGPGADARPGAAGETATQLRTDVSLDGPRCTIGLGGEVDMATVAQLRGVLHLVCASGHRLVVIDLGQLRFLSLAGLQVLTEAQQTLHAAGCRLVLCHLDALTRRVLAITGLDQVLNVVAENQHLMSGVSPDPGLGTGRGA